MSSRKSEACKGESGVLPDMVAVFAPALLLPSGLQTCGKAQFESSAATEVYSATWPMDGKANAPPILLLLYCLGLEILADEKHGQYTPKPYSLPVKKLSLGVCL